MLTIHHLSKTFHKNTPNEKTALKKLDLRLQKGDFVTVIGSNGAGKSTLFQAICGSFLCGIVGLWKERSAGQGTD